MSDKLTEIIQFVEVMRDINSRGNLVEPMINTFPQFEYLLEVIEQQQKKIEEHKDYTKHLETIIIEDSEKIKRYEQALKEIVVRSIQWSL